MPQEVYQSCTMCAGNAQRSNIIYSTFMDSLARSNPDAIEKINMDRAGWRVPFLKAAALYGNETKIIGKICSAALEMGIAYEGDVVVRILGNKFNDEGPRGFIKYFDDQTGRQKEIARERFMYIRPRVHGEAFRRTLEALEDEDINAKCMPQDFNNALSMSNGYQLILTANQAVAKNVRNIYYDDEETGVQISYGDLKSYPFEFRVEMEDFITHGKNINMLEGVIPLYTPRITPVGSMPSLLEERLEEGSIWEAIEDVKDDVAASVDDLRQTVRLLKEASPEMVRIFLEYAKVA